MLQKVKTVEDVIKLLKADKNVYVNGFDFWVKPFNGIYKVCSVSTGKIFCPLLNDDNKLILDGATYIVI